MILEEYNAFCAALPASAHVVQWGGAHVWKVGGAEGKVFAIAGLGRGGDGGAGGRRDAEADVLAVTFKTTPFGFELLRERPGLRPAPYLASRGLSWIQHYAAPGLDDAALRERLTESHALAAAGLSRKRRKELGLL